MLDRLRKPPTIYREAPTTGDYAVRLAVLGVGLSAMLLSGQEDQPQGASQLEMAIGVSTFIVGTTRLGEKKIHSYLSGHPDESNTWLELRVLSVAAFMTEERLAEDSLHPHTTRVYIIPSPTEQNPAEWDPSPPPYLHLLSEPSPPEPPSAA